MSEMISLGAKLAQLAAQQPDKPAVTCGSITRTYAELHRRSNRIARGLQARGVKPGALVTVGLPNGVGFVETCYGIWKLGATPQPVSYRLPEAELGAIVRLADSPLVVADVPMAGRLTASAEELAALSRDESDLPDAVPPVAKAPTSGGSTGRPKLILSGQAGVTPRRTPKVSSFRLRSSDIVLIPAPLYHNGPFSIMMTATALGAHLVLTPRFDPEATLAEITQRRATWLYLVPTMMNRIWRLPTEVREGYDVGTVETLWHMAAPCPPWLKEAFIGWFTGGEVMEVYAGTEAQAGAVISGAEWLAHRGSVGRVSFGEMKICDQEGRELPAGEIGEIYMRPSPGAAPTYRYRGAEAKALDGGWESLGDMGWFDTEGYLFLADRRADMILIGGSNVYPAEIEAALQEHPAVTSCAVIGLPDDDMGNVIHAIVQGGADLSEPALREHLQARLVSYKQPRTYEFVAEALRDDAGKVRRAALREARLPDRSRSPRSGQSAT